MKKLRYLALLILVLFVVSGSSSAEAKDTEFEFYYQTIENVVQINNPNPQGWWEQAKSLVKRGYTEVMKT